MNRLGRQISKPFQKLGRQMSTGGNKLGRQLTGAFKLMPQAFKDTGKVYSDIERKVHGVPIVSDIFGGASKATNAIGQALGGNLGAGFSGLRSGATQGTKALGDTLTTALMFA